MKEVDQTVDSTLLNYGNYDVLLPQPYCPGEWIRYIFAAPEGDAVATNEIDNSVSLLKFQPGNKIKRSVVKKDFMSMVTGPFEFTFMPVWGDNMISYSMTRGFLIINTSKKNVEIYSICKGLFSGEIGNVQVIDPQERLFAFEVRRPNGDQTGEEWLDRTIQVYRLKNEYAELVSEKPAGRVYLSYGEPWFVYGKDIFIYRDSNSAINCYDHNMERISHPLSDPFNTQSTLFRRMDEFVIHPTLPFAIIVERGKIVDLPQDVPDSVTSKILDEMHREILYLFRWAHPDPKQRLVPLVAGDFSIWGSYNPRDLYQDFSFSPDGKWLVFKDVSGGGTNPVFVAVPVDENNPLYLGKPVKLGNIPRETGYPFSTAWSTHPTAFCMTDGDLIYKWNLGEVARMDKTTMPPGSPDPFLKFCR